MSHIVFFSFPCLFLRFFLKKRHFRLIAPFLRHLRWRPVIGADHQTVKKTKESRICLRISFLCLFCWGFCSKTPFPPLFVILTPFWRHFCATSGDIWCLAQITELAGVTGYVLKKKNMGFYIVMPIFLYIKGESSKKSQGGKNDVIWGAIAPKQRKTYLGKISEFLENVVVML